MKAIKKNLVLGAAALAATAAFADFIFWQVNDPVSYGESVPFSYATISVDDGTSYLRAYNEEGDGGSARVYSDGTTLAAGPVYSGTFTSGEISRFLVELWGEDGSKLAWQWYTASDYTGSIWKGDDLYGAVGGGVESALVATDMVPEPTGGLLTLFGLAFLALRRRRA